MAMFAFCNTVLLACVRTYMTLDERCLYTDNKHEVADTLNPSMIERSNFRVKETLYMGLKMTKYMFNIRFVFDKINLGKMAKIIRKDT
jgi:hypothetical protein